MYLAPAPKNFQLIWIASICLSASPVLRRKCQRVFSSYSTLARARHAGRFDCLMGSLIVMILDRAEDTVAVLCMQDSQPNPQRKSKLVMCVINQIKICAEYRDMAPRISAGLPGTPRPCLTTAIWRCRKPFTQWQRSFQRKLCTHWLKFLRQRHVAVVRQGPGWAEVQAPDKPALALGTMFRYSAQTLIYITNQIPVV